MLGIACAAPPASLLPSPASEARRRGGKMPVMTRKRVHVASDDTQKGGHVASDDLQMGGHVASDDPQKGGQVASDDTQKGGHVASDDTPVMTLGGGGKLPVMTEEQCSRRMEPGPIEPHKMIQGENLQVPAPSPALVG